MPMRSEHVDADVFLEHKGVTIYHVYKDDDYDNGPRTYWYSTRPDGSDYEAHNGKTSFDVRELPKPETGPKISDHPEYMGSDAAVKYGFATYDAFKESDKYAELKRAWEHWGTVGEREAIENVLKHAIEAGVITRAVECCDCVWQGAESQLGEVKVALEPGDDMPPGTCPDCGSFARYMDSEDETGGGSSTDDDDSLTADLLAALRAIKQNMEQAGYRMRAEEIKSYVEPTRALAADAIAKAEGK